MITTTKNISPIDAYYLVKSNPTLEHKLLFIHAHEAYYGKIVFATLRNRFKQQHDVDEMVSAIKVRLIRYANNLNFSKSYREVLGYLSLVAVRTITATSKTLDQKNREHFFRDNRMWDTIKQPQRKLTPSEEIVADLREHANPEELIVIDRYVEGAKVREIAQELGISPSGVHMRLKKLGRRIKHIRRIV